MKKKKYLEIKKFLKSLYQDGILTTKYGENISYKVILCYQINHSNDPVSYDQTLKIFFRNVDFYRKEFDDKVWLEKLPKNVPSPAIWFRQGSHNWVSFPEFFKLLHPKVKKHFAYHLDLFL